MYPKAKTLLKAALLFFCVKLHAQTLTCQYSCPQPGEVFSIKTSSPVPHTAGLNQLWNFTQVAAVSSNAVVISYVDVASVPSSSLYPQATIAKYQSGNYAFMEGGNSGLKLLNPANATYTVNAESILLPLPFSYGSTYSETIYSTYLSGTDTIKVANVKHLNGVGTGTLMLPTGTYNDVLRISGTKTTSQKKNGVAYGHILTNHINYYYSEKISQPLLYSESKQTTGPEDYAPYNQFVSNIFTGITKESNEAKSAIKLAPNPAADKINISSLTNEKGKISLINALGELILQQNFSGEGSELDLSALPNGMYTVLITQGETTHGKKLLISR